LEFNVVYLKEVVGGNELREIDVYNGKYVMNGNDMLASVRQAIGI
jgi:phage tail tube protein FII